MSEYRLARINYGPPIYQNFMGGPYQTIENWLEQAKVNGVNRISYPEINGQRTVIDVEEYFKQRKGEHMEQTEILLRAISFATRAHDGQIRKDGETAYVAHPMRVCMILRQVFNISDEKILAAAVLHDTIEDTTTDYDDILKEFGEDIAGWVSLLSKDKRKIERDREYEYKDQLVKAPFEVKIIKIADVCDNLIDAKTAKNKNHMEKTIQKTKWYAQVFGEDVNNVELCNAIGKMQQLI